MYVHEKEAIESLKSQWDMTQALKLVNSILVQDPYNKDALMQIADIQYRSGNVEKAEKAVDFMISQKEDDAMSLYVKGILEMEKTNRSDAITYLTRAIKLTQCNNPEVVRAYWLAHYRYGNKEKWMDFLEHARELAKKDAEIVLNLCQVYTFENRSKCAIRLIAYYQKNRESLQTYDKSLSRYDDKINLYRLYRHENTTT